jgi:hypothetical protein
MTKEDPSDYRLIDGDRLCVCFDWVPYGMNVTLDLDADLCQKAVDGDKQIRGYIQSSARRSVMRQLIADLKRVIGPDHWLRAMEVLVEHESMKPEEAHNG